MFYVELVRQAKEGEKPDLSIMVTEYLHPCSIRKAAVYQLLEVIIEGFAFGSALIRQENFFSQPLFDSGAPQLEWLPA
jgi:prolipoprotein diacylglyceryltransferase